ncbi:hypothetical protein [Paenibacillus ihumii]|uniref:hypothetical protein n=1 Tax=Paenibacillus ihumii TaxID=687436 RepID=UPI00292A4100|nr:hypothetical protein [Paenibacillus ihumii]
MKKYINQVVEIIYMDRSGHITQRSIHIHAVHGELVRATCLSTGAPRAFRKEQILALRPVKQTSKQFEKMKLSAAHSEDVPVSHLAAGYPATHSGNVPINHTADYLVNHPAKHSAIHPANPSASGKGGSYHAS